MIEKEYIKIVEKIANQIVNELHPKAKNNPEFIASTLCVIEGLDEVFLKLAAHTLDAPLEIFVNKHIEIIQGIKEGIKE